MMLAALVTAILLVGSTSASTSADMSDRGGHFQMPLNATCVARPRVTVSMTPQNGGMRATLSAGVSSEVPTNGFSQLRLGAFSNATVEFNGSSLASNSTQLLASRPQAIVLLVRRTSGSGSVTVPLTVVDECGPWQTFVGGGPSQFTQVTATPPPTTTPAGTIDSSDARITWSGNFVTRNNPAMIGGSERVGEFAGASATLSFTGTLLTVVFSREPDRGIANVVIDGQPRGSIDQYGAVAYQQQVDYPVVPGNHTIVVTITRQKSGASSGYFAGVDAFIVENAPLAPNGTYCGEPTDQWHGAIYNGCATGHEHGDPPPAWIAQAGYQVSFAGAFNTSSSENSLKHAAMKGMAANFNGVDLYFRVHVASNVLDRSARYHSYEVWTRDPSGGVSHWQGWFNSGDPVADRVPMRSTNIPGSAGDPGRRPLLFVIDQTSLDQNQTFEAWYVTTDAGWSWDFGWNVGNINSLFFPGENSQLDIQSWRAPINSAGQQVGDRRGGTRRLEAAWYLGRGGGGTTLVGDFWATQFGEVVSGPAAPRCGGTTTRFGVTYQNVCLSQRIAPTMREVKFPGNSVQRTYDVSAVKFPN